MAAVSSLFVEFAFMRKFENEWRGWVSTVLFSPGPDALALEASWAQRHTATRSSSSDSVDAQMFRKRDVSPSLRLLPIVPTRCLCTQSCPHRCRHLMSYQHQYQVLVMLLPYLGSS